MIYKIENEIHSQQLGKIILHINFHIPKAIHVEENVGNYFASNTTLRHSVATPALLYAIKTQLKAPKAPYEGNFLPFTVSLWHKDRWLPYNAGKGSQFVCMTISDLECSTLSPGRLRHPERRDGEEQREARQGGVQAEGEYPPG